ncbi:MAG: hypothetical protein ACI9VR_003604 [Cognaticolwellia sp.]|jgi:hypothetical protein
MLLTLLLFACPKAPVETGPPAPPLSPILPAPYATVYTQAPGQARDPLVAYVARGKSTDETLSGAAGSMSLLMNEAGGIDQASLHWALITAGWPYQVSTVLVERVAKDQIPPAFESSVAELDPSLPIGVARSRSPGQDTWVLLVGQVPAKVRPFAREAQVGDRLSLQLSDQSWPNIEQRMLPPEGEPRLGPGSYDAPGEWLVELYGLGDGNARTLLLQLPVYVGEETPQDGPFLGVELDKPKGDEALRRAEASLNELRNLLGAPQLQMDPVALALAGKHARALDSGTAEELNVVELAARAGLRDSQILVCQGEGLNGCLDAWFWSIDARPALRDANLNLVGLNVGWTAEGMRVVALVAR